MTRKDLVLIIPNNGHDESYYRIMDKHLLQNIKKGRYPSYPYVGRYVRETGFFDIT